jgi:hypothetical protein
MLQLGAGKRFRDGKTQHGTDLLGLRGDAGADGAVKKVRGDQGLFSRLQGV